MTIWVDAHLSPAIATWITNAFGVEAIALRDFGLKDAEDSEISETLPRALELLRSSEALVEISGD